jgi:prepilin-type N-terminal cleavage/methylation domain-containing protein
MNHKAFTIVEILIVVALLAIVGMMAVPMMSSAASIQIGSAANMIAADLEYAKSMAISRGQYYSVVFAPDSDSYQIFKDQGGTLEPISHPVKKGFPYTVNFQNDSRLNKVKILSADFGGSETVTFDYLGSPDDGGSVSLQAAGISKTIRVEPVTGYISIGN